MQRIVPNVWFNRNALEGAALYERAFGAAWAVTGRYPTEGLPDFQHGFEGQPLTVDIFIRDYKLSLINSDDSFTPNPSISLIVNFDPQFFGNSVEKARTSLDQAWVALISDGGEALMEIGEYPHSERYGWVKDRFGLSWQLMLTNPAGEPRPPIVPQIMFGAQAHGKAQEALTFYTSVFPDSEAGTIAPYPAEMPEAPGLMFAEFRTGDDWISVMDGGAHHDFSFSCGMSLEIDCEGQAEIDRVWNALTAVPEAEACGWLADRFGVSWQVIPSNMGELMKRPNAFDHLMTMKKLVIDDI